MLCESYREAGKVKHRTIANLEGDRGDWVALRRKADLVRIVAAGDAGRLELVEGLALVGAGARPRHRRRPGVDSKWACSTRARAVGGAPGGRPRRGRGARHDRLRRGRSLRQRVDWLAKGKVDIKTRLFARRKSASAPDIFLYNVTSSPGRRAQRLRRELSGTPNVPQP